MKRNRQNVPLAVSEIHQRIEELNNDKFKLETEVENLKIFLSSSGDLIEKKKKEEEELSVLRELITTYKIQEQNLLKIISELRDEKVVLEKDNHDLGTSVEEKKKYIADIEQHKNSVTILQKEIAEYHDLQELKKIQSEKTLKSIYDKILDIQNIISAV